MRNHDAELDSLRQNYQQLAGRVRYLEEVLETWDSPWWKVILFALDGWPLRRVVERPQWRPWRRWFTS